METKLEEIEARYEAVATELASPDVARDRDRMRELGKVFAELGEIVEPYREYKAALKQAEDALELAKDEHDPEMAGFFREGAERAERRAEERRASLEQLLVPTDPNDCKHGILEARAGAGGQEASPRAGQLFDV